MQKPLSNETSKQSPPSKRLNGNYLDGGVVINKKPALILFSILIGSALVFVSMIFLPYEKSEKFEGFPVPQFAKVTTDKEKTTLYNWSRASFENGAPYTYRLRIKLGGWKEADRDGGMTVYEKDGRKVEVISLTDELAVHIK